MRKESNHRKLKISKLHKRYAVALLLLLILCNIGLILYEVVKKETTEKTQVASTFNNTPGISYQVYLKQNVLFDDTVQPEDTGYFSNLIDHIAVTFDNKYQGVNGAEYKGDYTIMGEITGWESGADAPVPAWSKQFVISPKKTFRTTDKQLILSQSANIDYSHFAAFTAQVGELTGYVTSYTMKVNMAVNYTITTKDGEVTGSTQPSLTIPLGESYFKILKSGTEEMKNDITKTVEVTVPIDYTKISLFSTICLLCLILLILIITSVEPTLTDLQRKRVKKLFKLHGSRMVAIDKTLVYGNLEACPVHSIGDLVKISDEIERPIFYVYRDDPAEIREFFITDREKAYIYKMIDLAKPEAPQEPSETNSKIAS